MGTYWKYGDPRGRGLRSMAGKVYHPPKMATDVRIVRATPDEIAAHERRHGRKPAVYRVVCRYCGKRLWWSGLGAGSHRRACPHTYPHGSYEGDGLDPAGSAS